MTSPGSMRRKAGHRAGEILLWCGAGLGTLSIVTALASVIFGLVPLVFTSGSMSPEVPTGSLGLARTVAASELRVGDIVSVTAANKVRVTHRIVATAEQADLVVLTLKGDTNPSPDQESYSVKEADRVFFTAPHLGRVITFLTGPLGMFVGGLAAATLLFWAFRRQPPSVVATDTGPEGDVQEHRVPPSDSGSRRVGHAMDRVVATLVALGVPALLLVTANSGTAAYFNDTAKVGTTGFGTHRLLQPDPISCTGDSNKITVSTTQTDARYSYWARAYNAAEGGAGVSDYKKMTGNPVTVTFDRSELNPRLGEGSSYWLRIHSRVGATGTTGSSGWESAQYRRQPFGSADMALKCGEAIPPNVVFTQPLNGSNGSKDQVGGLLAAQCGGHGTADPVACGTATDTNGSVTSVQYILQRKSPFTGTSCWNGSQWGGGCSYRAAARNAGQNRWSVPGGSADPYKSILGSYTYTLTIKAIDNDGYVSEKSISYGVGL